MMSVSQQLAEAYRKEQEVYFQISDLVKQQREVMEIAPDPGAVLQLCNQVEDLMKEISVIEEAIEPAKRRWQETRHEGLALRAHDVELDSVLAGIQALIEETARTQIEVQEKVLAYMRRQEERTGGARKMVKVNRARAIYGAV